MSKNQFERLQKALTDPETTLDLLVPEERKEMEFLSFAKSTALTKRIICVMNFYKAVVTTSAPAYWTYLATQAKEWSNNIPNDSRAGRNVGNTTMEVRDGEGAKVQLHVDDIPQVTISIFKAYDGARMRWMPPDFIGRLLKKVEGPGIMITAFVNESIGWLKKTWQPLMLREPLRESPHASISPLTKVATMAFMSFSMAKLMRATGMETRCLSR
ncbi:hypothetical protein EMCRGX_G033587 [Ephydatia muelleri]